MFEDGAMRLQEAAAFLGVSRRTVERWVASGEIPSTTIGGVRMIPRRSLIERLNEKARNAG